MTTTDSLHVILGRAAELWADLVGIKKVLGKKSMNMVDYEVRRDYEDLQEAIDLDKSGLTGVLYARALVESFEESEAVSLKAILDGDAEMLRRLTLLRQLRAEMALPRVVEDVTALRKSVVAAVTQYDAVSRKGVKEVIDDDTSLAVMVRDSLRSMERLQINQFLTGAPEPDSYKPLYVQHVHEWRNVNSLIEGCVAMPSGVSLNLIRPPDGFQAYFVIAIRNGGNLFLLGDKPERDHPLQGQMRRRPDRELEDRASRHWFPYDLLGAKADSDGRLYFPNRSDSTALVPRQETAFRLKPLKQLEAREIVWLALVFDLIVNRMWKCNHQERKLSYTGEMLKSPLALTAVASDANLPVATYKPLALAPLSVAEVLGERGTKALGKTARAIPDQWMLDRYVDRVTELTLNSVAAPDRPMALDLKSGEVRAMTSSEIKIRSSRVVMSYEREQMAMTLPLSSFDATEFGHREDMDADRRFIARYSLVKQVESHARREFTEREYEVRDWYYKAVESNMDGLLAMAAKGEIWLARHDDGVGYGRGISYRRFGVGKYERVAYPFMTTGESGSFGYRVISKHADGRRCAVTGARASFYVRFQPTCADDVMLLTGCSREQLPDVMRHFDLSEREFGNQILNRIDPALWAMSSPWKSLEVCFQIPLSRTARNELVKANKPLPEALTKFVAEFGPDVQQTSVFRMRM